MPIQQLQPEFSRAIYTGTWSGKPSAVGNAGKEIILTDWGRSRWWSNGTYWRPVGGRQVLINRFNSITLQNSTYSLVESYGPFPGGLVRSGMGLRLDTLWSAAGVGPGARNMRIIIDNSVNLSGNAANILSFFDYSDSYSSIRQASMFNAANDTVGAHPTGSVYLSPFGGDANTAALGMLNVDLSQPWYITAVARSAVETARTITGATWAGGVATFTAAAHTLAVGDKTVVNGVTPAGWNGTFIVASVPDANTFTVAMAANPGAYTSGGSSSRISNLVLRNLLLELVGNAMLICRSLEKAIAAGGETIIKDADDAYRCYMPGEIQRPTVEAPPPAPTLSAWQIRKVLNQMGLREAVEAAVAAGPQDAKDAWAYANEFERTHPLIENFAQALGKTDEDIDALFALGATL